MVPDKNTLLLMAKNVGYKNLIKTKEEFDWAEYKKQLSIVDGNVIDGDGVMLPEDYVRVEEVPGSFDIK